ncbi:MAG: DUF1893 domain-containing protein [Syntrophales bacterium]|nr:DUF1893 domain-containing protein [Syntrophales bacterium]MCK9390370.1 DUF1893 domain-containing protein [Syntrophales bacterium]
MTIPCFHDYSLAMFCGGRRVFTSSEPGLKPLVEWLEIYRSKYRGCLLHDKVVGLAAAKLIVYSGLISEVVTRVSSVPAKSFLIDHGVPASTDLIVNNIMTRDGTTICPGEVIALETDNRDEFLIRIRRMVKVNMDDFDNCRGQCGYTPWCRECKGSRGLATELLLSE